MILHIPHSSTNIPKEFIEPFIGGADEVADEIRVMTDWYTDELFTCTCAAKVVFPYSRLLVDVERFPVDQDEPMFEKGMGRFYTKQHNGKPLRRNLTLQEEEILATIYDRHHNALTRAVERELVGSTEALIIDCHSFPSVPLPCNQDQSQPRPDICLGTDKFHTPPCLTTRVQEMFENLGYSVRLNTPFAGTIVPMKHYQRDSRVHSLMIEINRGLYIDESTGLKRDGYHKIQSQLSDILNEIQRLQSNPGSEKSYQ